MGSLGEGANFEDESLCSLVDASLHAHHVKQWLRGFGAESCILGEFAARGFFSSKKLAHGSSSMVA